MLVGHYSSAFVGKAVAPRTPLWVFFVAAQLVDVVWAFFVLAGIERFTLDPALPSNPLVLEHMPFTHSLVGSLAWAALAAVVVARIGALGGSWRAGVVVSAVVLSHWVLDLIVHRPDLTLAGGDAKLGFALWNRPLVAFVVEIALLIATAAFCARRPGTPAPARRAIARGLGVLVLLQVGSSLGPLPTSTTALVFTMLASVAGLAWAAACAERSVSAV
ncbi:MAG: hypothetical protein IT293_15865 [Deltaproteobacteria bacterium]|nr:hypothetical protein [Deltaproteobacteria bacterium]